MIVDFPVPDPADVAIGARLRHWRGARGVELASLAEALGMTVEEARRVEAGRRHLTSRQIAAATTLLHLPMWSLVSDTPAY